MDEVVSMVAQRTGISEDQARTAVTTVLEFLKSRLPEPIAGQLDSVVGGGGGVGQAGDVLKGLGGVFGGGE